MAGTAVTRLQDQPFAAGGTVPIPVAGHIPPNRRILKVVFKLVLDAVQPAAGMSAQLGGVLHQLISRIVIGRRVSVSGLGLRFLNWMTQGREPNFPAGFPATASATFSREIVWTLSFVDHTARSPFDACPASELWRDSIQVTFGTNAIFAATAPTLGNGTLRTYVIHEDAGNVVGKTGQIASSLVMGSDSYSALTALVQKPGRYVYACAFREASNDAGAITSANVSGFTTYIDGVPLLNNLRAQDAASHFNENAAEGSNIETESQTDPRAGEIINELPGAAAAAGQGVTCNFLPLVVAPKGYLISQLPYARDALKFEASGTLGNYSIAYRFIEARQAAGIVKAVSKFGLPAGTKYTHKTASKSDLHPTRGALDAFLPLRLVWT